MLARILGSFVAVSLFACQGCPDSDTPGYVTFEGGPALTVLLADSDEERARGLMGVEDLPADEGMAFLYGEPTSGTFWMKDTLIPLSIAFVDAENQIVSIVEMEPCSKEPCPTYGASGQYVTAIEANAGWFDRHGIAEGDLVTGFEGPFCE